MSLINKEVYSVLFCLELPYVVSFMFVQLSAECSGLGRLIIRGGGHIHIPGLLTSLEIYSFQGLQTRIYEYGHNYESSYASGMCL